MFCIKCGAKNPDGSKFCSTCGATMVVTQNSDKSAVNPQTQPTQLQNAILHNTLTPQPSAAPTPQQSTSPTTHSPIAPMPQMPTVNTLQHPTAPNSISPNNSSYSNYGNPMGIHCPRCKSERIISTTDVTTTTKTSGYKSGLGCLGLLM